MNGEAQGQGPAGVSAAEVAEAEAALWRTSGKGRAKTARQLSPAERVMYAAAKAEAALKAGGMKTRGKDGRLTRPALLPIQAAMRAEAEKAEAAGMEQSADDLMRGVFPGIDDLPESAKSSLGGIRAIRQAGKQVGQRIEYTEEVGQDALAWISSGKSMASWCRARKIAYSRWHQWMGVVPGLEARYLAAMRARSHAHVDEMLEIADAPGVPTMPEVALRRLRIETRQWVASRINRELWGEKSSAVDSAPTITLQIGIPGAVQTTVVVPEVDPKPLSQAVDSTDQTADADA